MAKIEIKFYEVTCLLYCNVISFYFEFSHILFVTLKLMTVFLSTLFFITVAFKISSFIQRYSGIFLIIEV